MADATESLSEDLAPPRGTARRDRWLGLGSFAAMLALWMALTGSGLWEPLVSPAFLPSPIAVARTFVKLANTGYQGHTLAHHFLVSLMRFGIAFMFCVVVGVPVGLLMGMHSGVRAVLDPPIETTRPIPKLALLPLFIIWFGIGEVAKTIVIIAALFPLISISAMQAVRSVSLQDSGGTIPRGEPGDDLPARPAARESARHIHRHACLRRHRRHHARRRGNGRN
jgi:taurine transport system permease protein